MTHTLAFMAAVLAAGDEPVVSLWPALCPGMELRCRRFPELVYSVLAVKGDEVVLQLGPRPKRRPLRLDPKVVRRMTVGACRERMRST